MKAVLTVSAGLGIFAFFFVCTVVPCTAIKVLGSPAVQDAPWNVYPQYTVDLDLPPRQRWRHIIEAERDALVKVFESMNRSWDCHPHDSAACKPVVAFSDEMTGKYSHLTDEHMEELRGMHEVAQHPLVTMEHLIASNIAYELGGDTGCTGIVAATPTGEMIQGRALDLPDFADGRHYNFGLLHLTYKRGGVPIFTGISKVGQIGIHTGMRLGGYSFEENTHVGPAEHALAANLEAARTGAQTLLPFIRTILEEVSDYEEAVKRLSETRFIKPHYFVLAGAGKYQGAVITKPRNELGKVDRLNPASDWKLVQGNEDQVRMAAGYMSMTFLGQNNLTPETMLLQLQKPPVFNGATQFIYVMRPGRGDWLLWDTENLPAANIIRSTDAKL